MILDWPSFLFTGTPIVSTDQMSDWHAMMVSLMWNVQAWRDWIQENIDRALSYQRDPDITTGIYNLVKRLQRLFKGFLFSLTIWLNGMVPREVVD